MADTRGLLGNLVTGVLVSCAIVVTLAVVRREFFPGALFSPPPPQIREIEGWDEVVSGGLRFGSTESDVVVVEFADFQCPFCVTVAHSLRELRSEFAGQVSFVYRHFPLTSIHEHAMEAAIASECAARQGKFERYHDLLYEEQDAIGVRGWTVFAEMAGVPSVDKFRSCLEDEWPRERVMEDERLARRLRLDGNAFGHCKRNAIAGDAQSGDSSPIHRLQVDVDNCVAYPGRKLQLPTRGKPDWRGREVEVREFEDGGMEVWRDGRPPGSRRWPSGGFEVEPDKYLHKKPARLLHRTLGPCGEWTHFPTCYAFPGISPGKRGACGAARSYVDGGE